MYIQHAARKGHGIGHTSEVMQTGVLVVLVVGGVVAVVTGTAEVAVVVGAVLGPGGYAMDAAEVVDGFRPPSIDEHILMGLDSVRLGRAVEPAALAMWPVCVGDEHHLMMKEGSKIVLLGPALCPMSREADTTTCGGVIAEGEPSILVGGDPSSAHQKADEQKADYLRVYDAAKLIGTGHDIATAKTLGEAGVTLALAALGKVNAPAGDFAEVATKLAHH